MGADLKWYGEEALKHVHGAAAQRLEKAAILLKNATKEEISVPSPPPSAAGEPPHKDTGRLRASIAHEIDRSALVARVGTNVVYGKWLELGTRKMAPRPFLYPTLKKMLGVLRTILAGEGGNNG